MAYTEALVRQITDILRNYDSYAASHTLLTEHFSRFTGPGGGARVERGNAVQARNCNAVRVQYKDDTSQLCRV